MFFVLQKGIFCLLKVTQGDFFEILLEGDHIIAKEPNIHNLLGTFYKNKNTANLPPGPLRGEGRWGYFPGAQANRGPEALVNATVVVI